MKLLLILFFVVSFFGSAQAKPTVPKIKGLAYQKARQMLLKAGWRLRSKEDYEVASPSIMKKYPEVVGCAIDRPVCRFAFLGDGGKCLAIFTEGEEIHEFRVHDYSYECEKTK
ncbi:MAG: hypothetical protein AB9M53_03180 [Leptothrix sp. (in: b-proteobacteria)]